MQLGCGGPEWSGSTSWNEAIHPPAKNSQTRNRTPLWVTEPHCTFTPRNSEIPTFLCARKRAHYRNHGSATLAPGSIGHSFGLLFLNNSTRSAGSEAPRALAPAMHFPSPQGVCHRSNTNVERLPARNSE
jgi:hypothetical protein